MIPIFRRISDRIGRKKTFLFGSAVIVVTVWPVFLLVQTGAELAIIFGVALFLALGHAAV